VCKQSEVVMQWYTQPLLWLFRLVGHLTSTYLDSAILSLVSFDF